MLTENNKPDFVYRQKTPEQLKANYNSRIKKDLNAFISFEGFLTLQF